MYIRILVALLWMLSPAMAGGRGGHYTGAFDANLFPGATVTNFITAGATCNGVADDTATLKSWITSSTAANPTQAVLYIPPGSKCRVVFDGNFTPTSSRVDSTQQSTGIQNAVFWGYGASFPTWIFGAFSFFQDYTHSARIATASAGNSTVTLSTTSEASRFPSGSWLAITGDALQCCQSYPPNFQTFEYVYATNVNAGTGVITLATPLAHTYLSTWPAIDAAQVTVTAASPGVVTYPYSHGFSAGQKLYFTSDAGSLPSPITINTQYCVLAAGLTATQFELSTDCSTAINTSSTGSLVRAHTSSLDLAGPATVHMLDQTWANNLVSYGLTVGMNGVNSQVTHTGRNTSIYDIEFIGSGGGASIFPTAGANLTTFYSELGAQIEADKLVSNVSYYHSSATNLFVQSASIENLTFNGGRINGGVAGTPTNTTFINSNFSGGNVLIGPGFFGHGGTLKLDGSTIPMGSGQGYFSILLANVSYSSGVFTQTNAAAQGGGSTVGLYQWAIPGGKYFFANGQNHCSPDTSFTVTAISQTSTTTSVTTGSWISGGSGESTPASLPPLTNACSGASPDRLVAYPATSITQINSPAGSADLTQFNPQ